MSRRRRATESSRPPATAAAQPDVPSTAPGSAARTARLFWLTALLLSGGALWIWNLQAPVGYQHLLVIALAILIGAVPLIRRHAERILDRLRKPRRESRWLIALALAAGSAVYLFATAWWQGTDFIPRVVDESSYLIQMQMLARGHLWAEPHPPDVRPFFESFNLLVEPKYGSMYFPGTALLYVPAVWLGLPHWALPLAVSAACVGLLYLLVTELIDGVYGLAAALMLLGLTKFRALSVMVLSQTPMLMFGLLMLLAYCRWRRDRSIRWAIVIGGLAGWAGITRPADALCYAVPIGVAMLLDLRGRARARDAIPEAAEKAQSSASSESPSPDSRAPTRLWLATLASLVAGALPFLGLQAVQNAGMTAHWWEFPEARYADETYPAPMLGFHHVDPATARKPAQPQKRELNEELVDGLYRKHKPAQVPRVWWEEKLPATLTFGLPHPLFAILLPVGLLGLTDRRRRVAAAIPALFIGFYAFYVFYIPHYLVVLGPALIVLVLCGAWAIAQTAAPRRWRTAAALRVALPLAIAGVSIASLPEFDSRVHDPDIFGPGFFSGNLPVMEAQLAELSESLGSTGRAIVLFRFTPGQNMAGEEPVYNVDVAWPDDAKVIRAHDRGPQNHPLFRYFAVTKNQPNRVVYFYDRRTLELKRLGAAGELAQSGR